MKAQKECKDDEIRNPTTNRCVKRTGAIGKKLLAVKPKEPAGCKPDEILNPATNRCVKRTGVIGKKILSDKGKTTKQEKTPERKCRDDEILNPKTNKCVSRNSAIGRSLLQTDAFPDFFQKTKYVKPNNSKTLELEIFGKIDGIKRLTTMETDKQTVVVLFNSIDELLEQANKVKIDIRKSWEHTETTGDTEKELEQKLDKLQTCKKTKQIHIDVSKCTNQDTLVMMNSLKDIPPQDIIQLLDGYCFDVHELVDFCKSSGNLKNPLTNNSIADSDVIKIIQHPELSTTEKKIIKDLEDDKNNWGKMLKTNVVDVNPKRFEKFLHIFAMTAMICISDYSEDFRFAQQMLTRLSVFVDKKFPSAQQNLLLRMADIGGNTLQTLMRDYANICIHGVGYRLFNIVCHQYGILLEAKCKLQPLPYMTTIPSRKNAYMFLYNSSGFIDINVFDMALERIVVRLGFVNLENKTLNTNSLFSTTKEKAKSYFNSHVKTMLHKDVHIFEDLQKYIEEYKETIKFDNLKNHCNNLNDPITLEDFKKEDTKNIVMIGKDTGKKNCYTVESINQVYEKAILSNKIPKDPMNPAHVLTREEIQNIQRLMKKKNIKYIPPVYKVATPYPGYQLVFRNLPGYAYIEIYHNNNTNPFSLGLIPTDIEVADSGSTDVSSAVLIYNLTVLWENRELVTISNDKITPKLNIFRKWYTNLSNRRQIIQDFIKLCQKVQNKVDEIS